MKSIAAELQSAIEYYLPLLKAIPADALEVKPAADKWSRKEIIGHLIDSAQNNTRRFIVAQYEDKPVIGYQQDDWVRINNYQRRDAAELVQLWYLLNRQAVAVLQNTTDEAGQRTSITMVEQTIEWLAQDYIKHLKHHLHQVLGLEEVAYP